MKLLHTIHYAAPPKRYWSEDRSEPSSFVVEVQYAAPPIMCIPREHTPPTGGVRLRRGLMCDTPNERSIHTQQIKVCCRRARASQYEP